MHISTQSFFVEHVTNHSKIKTIPERQLNYCLNFSAQLMKYMFDKTQ